MKLLAIVLSTFLSQVAWAAGYQSCLEVMLLADRSEFQIIADVAVFAHEHHTKLAPPEVDAISRFAQTRLPERYKPTAAQLAIHKEAIEGLMANSLVANPSNLQQIAQDTNIALAATDSDLTGAHAPLIAESYIQFWTAEFNLFASRDMQGQDELMRAAAIFINRLGATIDTPLNAQTRANVSRILELYYYELNRRESKQNWTFYVEEAQLFASDDTYPILQGRLTTALETFVQIYSELNTRTNDRMKPANELGLIFDLLHSEEIWGYIVFNHPQTAFHIFNDLLKIQRWVHLYSDDTASKTRIDLLFHRLYIQLQYFDSNTTENMSRNARVKDVLSRFPHEAIAPQRTASRIEDMLRSYMDTRNSAVISLLREPIRDALDALRYKDELQRQRAARYLNFVIEELAANAARSTVAGR